MGLLLGDLNLAKLQAIFQSVIKRRADKIDPIRSRFCTMYPALFRSSFYLPFKILKSVQLKLPALPLRLQSLYVHVVK